ncbi:uncharacterized protein LOC108671660 [Hyalella azteca]|uniref:Uncharacterized protein LOC108671660 n=1 Tax=Hyalella azteca TaxID=294128 RepID=A0A8B7NM18_HYAAZ|nr:uncharacterized protein LOC108671660 [Hyalella azteca]
MGKGSKKRSSSSKSHVESGASSSGDIAKVPKPVMVAFIGIELIFGLVFIIVGSLNVDKCNIDKMIPIWLIMMGVVYLVTGVHEFLQFLRSNKPAHANKGRGFISLIITGVLTLITVALFVAGNVFVYRAWSVGPDFGHYWFENGCDMGAYMLSFVAVIFMDVLFGVIMIGILAYACCHCFCKK